MTDQDPGHVDERRRSGAKIAVALAVLAAAIAVAATRLDVLQGVAPSQGRAEDAPSAPEFVGIAGWINSPPLTLGSLRGTVTVIDFWTYSCINCVRTIPSNRRIFATYEPYGLQIVGVHSPEFAFEREAENVRAAVRRLGVTWPVAMDNDMRTWRAYRNAYWPRIYIVDAEGRIRFDYAGEGHEADIEANVRALLQETGRADLPDPIRFDEKDFTAHITPEIYVGYQRGSQQGSLSNREGFEPGSVVHYEQPSDREIHEAGTGGAFFVAGSWRNEPEYLEATSEDVSVILPFYARDVFFVAAPAAGDVAVRLLLDGKPLTTVNVSRSDLYTAVRLTEPGTHVLTIEAEKGFRLFTFTFG